MHTRHVTLRQALGLLPYSVGAAAGLSVALVTDKAWRAPGFAGAGAVSALSAAALVAAVLIALAARSLLTDAPSGTESTGAASWALGLQFGILLLPVSAFLLVQHLAADDLHWTWPYLNKRWLVALYAIAIGAFLIFPAAVEWWCSPADPASSSAPPAGPARPRQSGSATAGALAILIALAWYAGGPPWHLDRHHREIETHEQAHLGPLQALSKGYLPYIGPASTQYGPGAQVLLFQITRAGGWNIVSFRTAWAAFHFTTLLVFVVAGYGWTGFGPTLAALLIALTYSPLAFYGTAPDGTFAGFYGWASGLRYLAPFVVVPTLVPAAGVGTAPWRGRWLVLLGVVWGGASWLSQENLSSTAMAAGLLLSLLVFTRTIPIARAIRIGAWLIGGFAIAAAPVLAYYLAHGALGAFADNYFAVPRAVASGYSNTWWPAGVSVRTFYLAPIFFMTLAIATLWQYFPLGLDALDAPRARLLAFLSIAVVCFQVSLLRSDPAHLQNTMLAMPFVLVLGARDLPRWLAVDARRRWTIRVALVAAALLIFPSGKLLMWRQILVTPMTRFFVSGAPAASAAPPLSVAYARETALLSDEPLALGNDGMSMRAFLDFAGDVHAIVGSRKTLTGGLGQLWAGTLYFFADLTPAPYPLDADTMIMNERLEARVIEHVRAHPADYECFIAASLETPVARAFLDVHPGAQRIERLMGRTPIHILLAAAER